MNMTVDASCPRDCYDTCLLKVEVDPEANRVLRVRGDPSSPVTRGFVCPRGAADPRRTHSPRRILYPYVREDKPGGPLRRVTWREAIDLAAARLREVLETHGPESVLVLEYAGNMGLLTWHFSLRLWNSIGATRTDHTICSASGHAALRLHYGSSHGVMPEEIPGMRLVVFWGFNAAVSALHLWTLALEARRRGAKLVAVDPRRSETAEKTDLWVAPRPGTDVALAYGVMRAMVDEDLVDREFIEKNTYGYEHLVEELSKWSLERVERITGVPSRTVRELATLYGTLRPSATLIGFGMQKSLGGGEAVRAVSLIPALAGMHRGFYYSNSAAWLVDKSYLTGEKMARNRPLVVSQVALGRLLEEGSFKYIYIYNTNPASTLPNQNAVRRGLSRRDVFVVVHDTHWNETTDYADLVLPAPTYLEKTDVVVSYSHRYVRLSRRAIKPLGESRDEVWVMRRLASRLPVDPWVMEDPWEALKKALENALEDGDFDDLLEGKTLKLVARPRDEYPTPTGRIELYSTLAEKEGHSPLPRQPETGGGFTLITSAHPKYTHSQFQDVYGPIPPVVWVNPLDAESLGVRDGDLVRLHNRLGSVTLRAMVTDRVPPGVLWAPRLATGLDGNPVNSVALDEPQRLGGGSTFNSTRVFLEKAPNPITDT